MRIVVWLVRVLLFFVLFAFALNNQHEATVHWFFNYESRAPMVFLVLTAFALGCAVGVLAMLPSWWRHRRVAHRHERDQPGDALARDTDALTPPPLPEHPPRDGL